VERNLHDGAQQRLVTLSLALTMARGRLARESEAASAREPGASSARADHGINALLAEAADELGAALRELRELARGIHPAILVEEGLGAALESLAERSPIPVEVTAPANGRLPPPVEAAAYYVVCESLANAAKYSQASSVIVRVGRCASASRVGPRGIGRPG